MKVALLGGGNCHALAFARHFNSLNIDCFGIGRGKQKHPALWCAPFDYRYYVAHLGTQLGKALSILDDEKPDVVVNIAAQGEGAASFGADAWRYYHTNCVTLSHVVEALSKRKYLERFVQISTSELYGSTELPASESSPIRAGSPYAVSKAAFDDHLRVMHRIRKFPIQIVRPSNCYTVGQQLHRVIPRAVVCSLYGRRMVLSGGGIARKGYLDSEDLAGALMTVIDCGDVGETYNAGPDAPVSILELAEKIGGMTGNPDYFDSGPERLGEDSCYWMDASKLKGLGWSQKIGLDAGLKRMVAWGRDHPEISTMQHEFVMQP